jgi:hypothetical protein
MKRLSGKILLLLVLVVAFGSCGETRVNEKKQNMFFIL